DRAITLVAGESRLPYERPPMSKEYLAGQAAFDDAVVHPASWYADNDVTILTGTRATAVDAASRRVTLSDGQTLASDKRVLATRSTPRRLPLPGADASGVHYLRTVDDSDAIRASFGPGKRVVIVGGGWIGLEVAAAARGAETDVT